MFKSKAALFVIAAAVGLLAVAGCGKRVAENTRDQSESIQIKGSDTMFDLGSEWADVYMKNHPQISIMVTGGGSGGGIAALIDGSTDIAQASRPIEDTEMNAARHRGVYPTAHVVAIDALSIIVNQANPVNRLTIPQMSDIFTGKITNWKQVGGNDAPIVILSRPGISGTHVFFLEHVVRMGNESGPQQYDKSTIVLPSNAAIASRVADDENAIGYVGLEFINRPKLKAIAVSRSGSEPYVEPSVETAESGKYPVSRSLYLYVNGNPGGNVKQFLDYVLSVGGQEAVKKVGFCTYKK